MVGHIAETYVKGLIVKVDCNTRWEATRSIALRLFVVRLMKYMTHVHVRYMLSPVRLSVTLVHPTQAVEIFGNFSTAFGTLPTL